MAAGINDKWTQATNGSRPVPTTLTALRGVGAGTISCAALTGWPTATAVHFIIYRTDSSGNKVAGSQTDWKGIVSGTTITGLVLKAGTDLGDSIGAIVECAPTAAWANDMATGLAVEHNQDGTHAAVTATSATVSGTVQGATVISTGDVQRRSISTETIDSERFFDYIASGGVWTGDSYGASLNASMTAIVYYINGRRFTIGAITARAFTASKDTYIDYDNAGVVNYTEVANNAASPALSANRIRGGIIVSGANIASAASVNLGQEDRTLPIVSSSAYSVTDSLGNLICPRDPTRKVLGYRYLASAPSGLSATTSTQIPNLGVPVIVPTGRRVKVTFTGRDAITVGGAVYVHLEVWNGTVGAGTKIGASQPFGSAASVTVPVNVFGLHTPSSSSQTYNAGYFVSGNSIGFEGGTGDGPLGILVELE